MAREELKDFRRGNGLTQAEMAKKLDISLSHYKGIEGGSQDPSFKMLCKFYEVFKDQYNDIWALFGRA